jgi:hypothetical protein
VPESADRATLESIEEAEGDRRLAVGILAARAVEIDEAERRAAGRRALLVLAAGGDPHREIDFDGVALRRLAGELDRPARRAALEGALGRIRDDARALPLVRESAEALLADPDFAWHVFAVSVLVDELEEGD